MNTLKLNLEHCFGIEKLNHEFSFSEFNTNLIYASNGVMKTSFANTFLAVSKGEAPIDRLYDRTTICEIECDDRAIDRGFISVIKSFEEVDSDDAQTKLLVDEVSKREYDEIYTRILDQKRRLIIDLNHLSGVKKNDIEETILQDFDSEGLFDVLQQYIDSDAGVENFSDLKYSEIFNQDVIDFLSKSEVQEHISDYFEKYNELLQASPFFRAGIFNPSKADTVAQTLRKENFFEAEHSIKLAGEERSFDNYDDLNNRLLEERRTILSDDNLIEIEREIKKAAVKNFREILEQNSIVSELNDLQTFRKKLWFSYFSNHRFHIETLLQTHQDGVSTLREIEARANEQSTAWDNVIEVFNQRFHVPFTVRVENKASSILGQDVPLIKFVFIDPDSGHETELTKEDVGKQDLLSQGEKRALYLMNILFNVQARKKEELTTLFIIDDIADSFDYKNKYAIIQYLLDISKEPNFYQIILTHNFDFFRTVQSRILGERYRRGNSYVAVKCDTGVELIQSGDRYQNNPFNTWRNNLNDTKALLSSIPFVRNLVEYKNGSDSTEYIVLTSLLHKKDDTESITINQLETIFTSHIACSGFESHTGDQKVFDILQSELASIEANSIPVSINLEEKIILSIGIRLEAETYMMSKVSDQSTINGSQTGRLFERFKSEFSGTMDAEIKVLDRVNLITPENIHINSFMFEPILDLSINHLKQLYGDVKSLS